MFDFDEAPAHVPARTPGAERTSDASRILVCATCRHPVTRPDLAIERDGRHVHHCTNPAGVRFVIGCFAVAPGAAAHGAATPEHSWFAGTRWRYAACRGCGAHLGWRYEGVGTTFFGLILARLSIAGD